MKTPEELTEQHLTDCAFWAFDLADEFDTELEPLRTPLEISRSTRSVVVRTSFKCQNGRELIGYIEWWAKEGIEYLQPTIVVGHERLDFYFGVLGISERSIERCRQLVGADAFPILFESENSEFYPKRTGQLNGFYYMTDEGSILLRKIG